MSKKLLSIFALLAAMLLLAACGGTQQQEPEPTTPVEGGETPEATDGPTEVATTAGCTGNFKIAYQGPLTGDYAALGENMINGIQLAVDQASEAGEVGEATLEVVEFDSQGSGDQAPPLAQQAAADTEIIAMVGPAFSGESQASGPILDEAGLPFITPSATTPSLSEQGWTHFFRTVGSDADQGPVAAAFIAEDLGATKVAVMDDSSDYGKPLADFVEQTLEGMNVEIVAREGVEPGQQDYSAAVGAVVQSGAEAIFYGGYYQEAGLIKRQLADQGFGDVPFVSDDGTFDNEYFTASGEAGNTESYVTYPGIDVTSADPEFVSAYQEAFDTDPGAFSVESYQNTRIIIEGLKAGNCDREAMTEFIRNFDGEVAGKQISFGENGDITAGPFTVYKAENGEWVVHAENLTPPEG